MEYILIGYCLLITLALVYEHKQHRAEVSDLLDRIMAKDSNDYLALHATPEDDDYDDDETIIGIDSPEVRDAMFNEEDRE